MTFLSGRVAALPKVYEDLTGRVEIAETVDGVTTTVAIYPRSEESVASLLERCVKMCNEQLTGDFEGVITSEGKLAFNSSVEFTISGAGTSYSTLGFAGTATGLAAIGSTAVNEFFPSIGAFSSYSGGTKQNSGGLSFQGFDLLQSSAKATATGGTAHAPVFKSVSATAILQVSWRYAFNWMDLVLENGATDHPTKVDLWDGERVVSRYVVQSASARKSGKLHTAWNLSLNLMGAQIVD